MTPPDALKVARQNELDLVEIAPTARPSVCRIIDFTKYKYDQEKKERESRKRQRATHLKEVKLRPHIEEHDYRTKLAHLTRFLKRGDKVKVTLMFRGREMAHTEFGNQLLDRLAQDAGTDGMVERPALLEGRNMTMILTPK